MTNFNDDEKMVAEILANAEEPNFVDMLYTKIGTLEKAVEAKQKGELSQDNIAFFSKAAFNTAESYIVAVEENPQLAQRGLAWRLSEVFDKLAPTYRDHEARTALYKIAEAERHATLG